MDGMNLQSIARKALADHLKKFEGVDSVGMAEVEASFKAGWNAFRHSDAQVVGVATIHRELGMTVKFNHSFTPHNGEELDFVRRVENMSSDVCPGCGCIMEGPAPHPHKDGCPNKSF